MNGFFSKTTLYDQLSMIIPGYLILYLFREIYFPECDKPCDELTYVVVIFTVSYIVGMMIHLLSKLIFRFLRNNKYIIAHNRTKYLKNNGITDQLTDNMLKEYYTSYYKASRFPWSSIPIIESQYSFLRSMVLVELLYLTLGCRAHLSNCAMSLIAILLIITILLMGKSINDISYRTWEDAHYTNLLSNS